MQFNIAICNTIVCFDASPIEEAVMYASISMSVCQYLWERSQPQPVFSDHSITNDPLVLDEITLRIYKEALSKPAGHMRWKRDERINTLEMSTEVLAAEVFNRKHIRNHRVIVFTDSNVKEWALEKGR
ncbi:hypothetical protein BWQ96_06217 [Gracilariopsis chorda]|uniref:Uncharacterized protein n=1 Tax=Gracilariopsis chorda TaxID=448386 RepID=A0A2V3IPQ0_9FLOR|nr:hypothetical protein BWQ96_06217 [Gracilariopsis chorda]|eukprot:PXF44044.1 hypothetical protein BWQ96_06217 [Gracilariopsis chorda]